MLVIILLLNVTNSKKVKVKVVPVFLLTENHAMKVYWRSGGIHAFYLGTRWR
jgi:hypothetical protein